MYILSSCSDPIYSIFLYPIKNVMTIIMIAAPIILIVSLMVIFTKGLINPEDKKVMQKIKNAILATIIVFLTSCIVSIAMSVAGNSTDISECWNKAKKPKQTTKYYDINNGDPKKPGETKKSSNNKKDSNKKKDDTSKDKRLNPTNNTHHR